jgi:hypothetical protein
MQTLSNACAQRSLCKCKLSKINQISVIKASVDTQIGLLTLAGMRRKLIVDLFPEAYYNFDLQ